MNSLQSPKESQPPSVQPVKADQHKLESCSKRKKLLASKKVARKMKFAQTMPSNLWTGLHPGTRVIPPELWATPFRYDRFLDWEATRRSGYESGKIAEWALGRLHFLAEGKVRCAKMSLNNIICSNFLFLIYSVYAVYANVVDLTNDNFDSVSNR